MTRTDLTDITMILDRSGSMASVAADTIGGFNTFLDKQKEDTDHALLTLVQFDNEYEVVFDAIPVGEVPPLDDKRFIPRGSTALLDAIARTINATGQRLAAIPEDQRPGQVLMVIITDGQENSSREFSRAQVMKMIEHQTNAYKWQFVFLGANQDAISEAGSLGISAGASLTYASTPQGTADCFAVVASSTSRHRQSKTQRSTEFFTDEERAKVDPSNRA